MAQTTKEQAKVPVTTTPAPNGMRNRPAFLEDIADEFARIWGQTWPLMPRPFLRPLSQLTEMPMTWAPRVDVFEKNGDIVVKAELPGVNKDDVKVRMDNDDLLIEGERRVEQEVKEKDYYRMERAFGSFYRRIPMPAGIAADKVRATFTAGVLEIQIPKPAEAESKAKEISIS